MLTYNISGKFKIAVNIILEINKFNLGIYSMVSNLPNNYHRYILKNFGRNNEKT